MINMLVTLFSSTAKVMQFDERQKLVIQLL